MSGDVIVTVHAVRRVAGWGNSDQVISRDLHMTTEEAVTFLAVCLRNGVRIFEVRPA